MANAIRHRRDDEPDMVGRAVPQKTEYQDESKTIFRRVFSPRQSSRATSQDADDRLRRARDGKDRSVAADCENLTLIGWQHQ